MKVHIRGKYSKDKEHWTVSLPSLNITVSAQNALKAFENLKNQIEQDLGTPAVCTFMIQDEGVFHLKVCKSDAVVNFIAKKVQELSQSEEHLKDILNQIKFKGDLCD